MDIVKVKIGNAITSAASNHVVAVTQDIYDEDLEKYQSEINAERKEGEEVLIEAIDSLSSKHDTDVTAINNAIAANKAETDQKFSDVNDEQEVQDSRLNGAEQEIADLNTIIKKQQEIIDALTQNFTLIDLGRWENVLMWENDALWANYPITQQVSAGVSVINYDPTTQTLTI